MQTDARIMDNEPSSNEQQRMPIHVLNSNVKSFPVIKFKIIGGIQVAFGILTAITCLAAIVLVFEDDTFGMEFLVLICHGVSLLLSGWAIMTGSLPMCMAPNGYWRGLKITFMVCSIAESSVFAPGKICSSFWTVWFVFNGYDVSSRDKIPIIALSITICALSFFSMVVAIVSACFCCCTTWDTNDQQVFVYLGETKPSSMAFSPHTQIGENHTTQEQHVVIDTDATTATQEQPVFMVQGLDKRKHVFITKRKNNPPKQYRMATSNLQPTSQRKMYSRGQRYEVDSLPPYTSEYLT